ncbi:MAG: methyltransferase [Chitinophagaceae bacterium]
MANTYFQFKQFRIEQDKTAMKVTTDACLLGAWAASLINHEAQPARNQPVVTDNEIGQTSLTPIPAINQPAVTGNDKVFHSTGQTNILDIGTGTGLLTLMLAQAVPAIIDAVEINAQASTQATENFRSSPWNNRLRLFNTGIAGFNPGHQYDYIISNPPFYENDLRSGVTEKDLAFHDSGLSLDQLFSAIDKHLSPSGKFYLLLPIKRKQDLVNLIEIYGFGIEQMEEVRQSIKHDPFRILVCGSRKKTGDFKINDRAIKEADQLYTTWFTGLLQPYYLHL